MNAITPEKGHLKLKLPSEGPSLRRDSPPARRSGAARGILCPVLAPRGDRLPRIDPPCRPARRNLTFSGRTSERISARDRARGKVCFSLDNNPTQHRVRDLVARAAGRDQARKIAAIGEPRRPMIRKNDKWRSFAQRNFQPREIVKTQGANATKRRRTLCKRSADAAGV